MIKRGARPSANFYILRNQIVEDENLSLDSMGLLVYLLTRPDNWQISETHLRNKFKIGRDKVRKLLDEICNAGYAAKYQEREVGKFARNHWIISETPFTEKPSTADFTDNAFSVNGEPGTDKPSTANTTLNKDLYITSTKEQTLSHISMNWSISQDDLFDISEQAMVPEKFIIDQCVPSFIGHYLNKELENPIGELLKWVNREKSFQHSDQIQF